MSGLSGESERTRYGGRVPGTVLALVVFLSLVVASACAGDGGETIIPIEPGAGVELPSGEFIQSEAHVGKQDEETEEATLTTEVRLGEYLRIIGPSPSGPETLGSVPLGTLQLGVQAVRLPDNRAEIQVTAVNIGELPVRNVVLKDTVDDDLFVSHRSTGMTCNREGGTVICKVGTLAPHQEVTLKIDLSGQAFAGMISNVARLQASAKGLQINSPSPETPTPSIKEASPTVEASPTRIKTGEEPATTTESP